MKLIEAMGAGMDEGLVIQDKAPDGTLERGPIFFCLNSAQTDNLAFFSGTVPDRLALKS